jgi:hypothetical protein
VDPQRPDEAEGAFDLSAIRNVTTEYRTPSPVSNPESDNILGSPQSPEQERFRPEMAEASGTGGTRGTGGTIEMEGLQALLQTIINQQRPPSSGTKIKDPKPFNGEQSKLRPFIAHCELKFQIENTKFDTDARKTAFAGALLEGVAWNWVEPFLTRREGLNQTWTEFKDALEHAFGEVDREEVAYEKFQKIEQGNRTAAAYWAEFQKIKADLAFPDNVCIARFRNGLHLEVKRYMVLHGTPTTNLTTFATAAIQADSRLCQLGLIARRPSKEPEP